MSEASRDRRLPVCFLSTRAGGKPAVPGNMLLPAVLLLLSATSAFAGGDPAKGKAVFAKCHFCHQLGEGAKNSVGPELNGVVGRPAASLPGYTYSAAMKAWGRNWDDADLQAFLASPSAVVPHTKMTFQGLRDPQAIEDVIAYLRQFGPDGRSAP